MYYFADMYQDKLTFIRNIDEQSCRKAVQACAATKEVLEFYVLGKCVADALEQLVQWSNQASKSGNDIMRNSHTAERLVRGFLFEFRTCLDHMETEIKQKYGEDSALWQIFKDGTARAYDECPEYAFTYRLRNCSQHCKNVVHGFHGTHGIGISSSTAHLLSEFGGWKQVDREFMQRAGDHIDLVEVFQKTFSAFNHALKSVVQYLLNQDSVGGQLWYLRRWGESLSKSFHHEVHCFHIVELVLRDGGDATLEDMETKKVDINAHLVDWEMIYEMTDRLLPESSSSQE